MRSAQQELAQIELVTNNADLITCLYKDRTGAIWVCTPGSLHRLSPRWVRHIAVSGIGYPVAGADGSSWVATDDGILRMSGRKSRTYTTAEGLPSSVVYAVLSDPRGTIWATTDNGIAQFVSGRFRALRLQPPTRFHRIIAITSDSRGNIWLCDMYQGVFRLRDNQLTKIETVSDASNATFYTVFADSANRVWVGLSNGILGYLDRNDRFVLYDRSGDFRGGIYSFFEDRAGALWIAGRGGLARFKDQRFVAATATRNEFAKTAYSIVDDTGGSLWISTSDGIINLDPAEFDKLALVPSYRIKYRAYDDDDGLSTGYAGSSVTRLADGSLRFATGGGIAIIDPVQLQERRVPVRAHIEAVRIGTQRFPAVPQLRVPPVITHLQIDYTAVTFASPTKVTFRYRLEGFDESWTHAGPRREAIYTNLPPGEYRFRVVAEGKNGPSESSEARLGVLH